MTTGKYECGLGINNLTKQACIQMYMKPTLPTFIEAIFKIYHIEFGTVLGQNHSKRSQALRLGSISLAAAASP
jgi:hypothetical protein